jgi:toxin-antitoxin system PIN domain toxin
MYLIDVNILAYAFRSEMPDSDRYAAWLEGLLSSGEPFGMADLVMSGFLRIVTHPKIFVPPSTLDRAMQFIFDVTNNPNCIRILPGAKHWDIFLKICKETQAEGNRISDAYFAALAIESNCEWITADRHFACFSGLKWRHPFD